MKRTISVQSGVYRCALLLSTLLLPLAGMALEPEQRQAAQSQLSLLTRALDFEAQRASSSNKDLGRNGDAHSILPGESLTLLDAAGPGIVNHFWNTVGTADPFYARSLVLRIYYDGQESPSVEAPLGDFFGVGHGAAKELDSIPVSVSSLGRSRVCYWAMPFRKHIRVVVANENPAVKVDSFYYYLDWQKVDQLPEDTLYFHARYRQEAPASEGNYTILQTEGRGHYVGTVLSVHQMETGWFGEGDDFFYIDHAETPQLKGTGTEDYFNDAWGFREFCRPYHGVSLYEGVVVGDRVTAYRWHILDPVPFKESLRLEIEHKGSIFDEEAPIAKFEIGGFIERSDWVSSVAFWYQYPPVNSDEPFPAWADRMPPYKIISASDLSYKADPPLLVLPLSGAILYAPMSGTGEITYTFAIEEKGTYRLDGLFTHSLMCGVYQPYLDDAPIGAPVDFSAPGFDPLWMHLDTLILDAGEHHLKFVGTGATPRFYRSMAPLHNGIGILSLSVLHLEEMAGFKVALKKEQDKKELPHDQNTGR
ncbi:MAG TPA: DUF2961 domain-containing protein [Candidatus Hydrogenedentes bacterium]|jgi:hypothetical protein|nr:MAG: hypothetical protein BWY07_02210 [Candidatus Hydrogenedentes bacterium ADurb.Bin170]HNZ47869.1 DUF2961 domain-containing protein [Candidatus Hydrogenedentota bacterium]HOD94333.1 DUF2961 domain-containing protein [Candidatus Hydrogenedentota bacterium]HOM47953.1 DUF2961 domain-containing protein [Candidatus Hydrogenedentota bacterium]HOR49994.1 DUF2961 domain-containing protein [Candidatus Hydrogenedentota bacterium]